MADCTSHSGINRWSQGTPNGAYKAHTSTGNRTGEWYPKEQAGFNPIAEYRYGQWQGMPRVKSLPALKPRIVREEPPSPGSSAAGSYRRDFSTNFRGLPDTRAWGGMPAAGVSTWNMRRWQVTHTSLPVPPT